MAGTAEKAPAMGFRWSSFRRPRPIRSRPMNLVGVRGALRIPKGTKTPIGVLSSPFARVGRSRNDQLNGRVALDFVGPPENLCMI